MASQPLQQGRPCPRCGYFPAAAPTPTRCARCHLLYDDSTRVIALRTEPEGLPRPAWNLVGVVASLWFVLLTMTDYGSAFVGWATMAAFGVLVIGIPAIAAHAAWNVPRPQLILGPEGLNLADTDHDQQLPWHAVAAVRWDDQSQTFRIVDPRGAVVLDSRQALPVGARRSRELAEVIAAARNEYGLR